MIEEHGKKQGGKVVQKGSEMCEECNGRAPLHGGVSAGVVAVRSGMPRSAAPSPCVGSVGRVVGLV